MIFNREHSPIVNQILESLTNEPETWKYDEISGDLVNRNLGVDFRDLHSRTTLKVLIRRRGWLVFSAYSSRTIWKAILEWFNRGIHTANMGTTVTKLEEVHDSIPTVTSQIGELV